MLPAEKLLPPSLPSGTRTTHHICLLLVPLPLRFLKEERRFRFAATVGWSSFA